MPIFQCFYTVPKDYKSTSLRYLTPTYRKLFNSGFALIDRCLTSTVLDDYVSLAEARLEVEYAKVLDTIPSYQKALVLVKKNHVQTRGLRRRETSWQYLNQTANWHALKRATPKQNVEIIKAIEEEWWAQGLWVKVTDAVLLLAWDTLQDIQEHLLEAEAEYQRKHHSLSRVIADQYGTYLNQLRQTIEKQQAQMQASLYYRFTQLQYAGCVLTAVKNSLIKAQTTWPDKLKPLPAEQTPLVASYNSQFYQRLAKSAQGTIQIKLNRIVRNWKVGLLPLVASESTKRGLFVPSALSAQIKKPIWPFSLLKGRQLRWQYFDDKQDILHQIVRLEVSQAELSASMFSSEMNWQQLVQVQIVIAQLKADMTAQHGRSSRWRHRQTRVFFEQAQVLLNPAAYFVLEKQLVWLEVKWQTLASEGNLDNELETLQSRLGIVLNQSFQIEINPALRKRLDLYVHQLVDYNQKIQEQKQTKKYRSEADQALYALLNEVEGTEENQKVLLNAYMALPKPARCTFVTDHAATWQSLYETLISLLDKIVVGDGGSKDLMRLKALAPTLSRFGGLTIQLDWPAQAERLGQAYQRQVQSGACSAELREAYEDFLRALKLTFFILPLELPMVAISFLDGAREHLRQGQQQLSCAKMHETVIDVQLAIAQQKLNDIQHTKPLVADWLVQAKRQLAQGAQQLHRDAEQSTRFEVLEQKTIQLAGVLCASADIAINAPSLMN